MVLMMNNGKSMDIHCNLTLEDTPYQMTMSDIIISLYNDIGIHYIIISIHLSLSLPLSPQPPRIR